MYLNQFAIESAAQEYRKERHARAERERRLALLARPASRPASLRDRVMALASAVQQRLGAAAGAPGQRRVRPVA